ncbi:msx2-interacting protein isoform X2 [Thalassophryne amazonica]|uniref:msx2-interacting protein isoform X2 n=1 Tax=Thalassophryne amazonica TaxID=390379 RepID=UPI00147139DC|nr:msx2-interacting protein isoform X2 [Thalassophryne amazonica]
MVRETRHLWVGNLPENVREEKIIEHFKRYGRVESVKVLPKRGSEGGVAAFVDFVDIKSAQKAHNAVNKMGDRDLRTDYNEPGTIPSAARGLDDSLSLSSRGRDVSGFTRAAGGTVYGPPTSLHSRDGRYERRLDGDSSSSSSDDSPARSVQSAAVPAPSALTLSSLDKDEPRKSFGIKVQNLPVRSTDTSLKDGLFHEFKKHGKVTSVQIHGASEERYGLVFFRQQEDQEKALGTSKGKLFFGMQIEVTAWNGPETESENEFRPLDERIDEFHPKATRTLFIGNLEKTTTYHDLLNIFQRFGEIVDIDIKKVNGAPQYAFLQYCDIASVCKAIKKMDGEYLGNNRLKLGFGKSMPTTCVWLDGLASNTTEQFLTRHFCRYGHVVKVVFDRLKGMALILYNNIEYAQAAVKDTKGWKMGGNKIKVDFANQESQMAFYRSMQASGQDIRDFYDILSERRDDRRSQYDFQAERQYYENVRTPGAYSEDPRRKYSGRGREFYADWDPYQGDYYEPQYFDDPREYREYRADPYEQDIRKYSYLQRERERERERFETDRGRDHGRRTIERNQSPSHITSRRPASPTASPSLSERIPSDSDRRICCRSSERSGSCSSVSPPRFEKLEKARTERYNKTDKIEKDRVFENERGNLTEKEKRARRKDRGDKEKSEKQRLKKLKVASPVIQVCEIETEIERDVSPDSALRNKNSKMHKEGSSKGRLDLLPCVVQLTRVREKEGKLIGHSLQEKRIPRSGSDSPRLVSPSTDRKSPPFRSETSKGDLKHVKVPREKNTPSAMDVTDDVKSKSKKHAKSELGFESGISVDIDRLAARKRRFEDSGKIDRQKRTSEEETGRSGLHKQWNNIKETDLDKSILHKMKHHNDKCIRIVSVTSPKDGRDCENNVVDFSVGALNECSTDQIHSLYLKVDCEGSKSETSSTLTNMPDDGRLDLNESKEQKKHTFSEREQSRRKYTDSDDSEEQFVSHIDKTNIVMKKPQRLWLQPKLGERHKLPMFENMQSSEADNIEKDCIIRDVGKVARDITNDFPSCKRKKLDIFDLEIVGTKQECNFISAQKLNVDSYGSIASSLHHPGDFSANEDEETVQVSLSTVNKDRKYSPSTEDKFSHAASLKNNFDLTAQHFQSPDTELTKLKTTLLACDEAIMQRWERRINSDSLRVEMTFPSGIVKCKNIHRRLGQDLEPGEVQSDSDDDGENKRSSPKTNSSLSYILREREERMTDLKVSGSLEKNKFYSFALDKTITPDTKALLERAKTLYSSREDNWSFLPSRFPASHICSDKDKVELTPRPIPSWYMKKKKIRTDSDEKLHDKKEELKPQDQERQELFASRFLHSSIFEQDSRRLQHLERKDKDFETAVGMPLSKPGINETQPETGAGDIPQEPIVLFHSRFLELQQQKDKDHPPQDPEEDSVLVEFKSDDIQNCDNVPPDKVSEPVLKCDDRTVISTLTPSPAPLVPSCKDVSSPEKKEVVAPSPDQSVPFVKEEKSEIDHEVPSSQALPTLPTEDLRSVTPKLTIIPSAELSKPDTETETETKVQLIEPKSVTGHSLTVELHTLVEDKSPTPGSSPNSFEREAAELTCSDYPQIPEKSELVKTESKTENDDTTHFEEPQKTEINNDIPMPELEAEIKPLQSRRQPKSKRAKSASVVRASQSSQIVATEKPATRKSERIDKEKLKRASSPRAEVLKVSCEPKTASKSPMHASDSEQILESSLIHGRTRRRNVRSVYATLYEGGQGAKEAFESSRSMRKRGNDKETIQPDIQPASTITRRGRPPKRGAKRREDLSLGIKGEQQKVIEDNSATQTPVNVVKTSRSPRAQKVQQTQVAVTSGMSANKRGSKIDKQSGTALPSEQADLESHDESELHINCDSENTNSAVQRKEKDSKYSCGKKSGDGHTEITDISSTEKRQQPEKNVKIKMARLKRNAKQAIEDKSHSLKNLEIRVSVDDVKGLLHSDEHESEPFEALSISKTNTSVEGNEETKKMRLSKQVKEPDTQEDDALSESEFPADPAATLLARQMELEQAVENIAKLTVEQPPRPFKEPPSDETTILPPVIVEPEDEVEEEKTANPASETELAAAIDSITAVDADGDGFAAPSTYTALIPTPEALITPSSNVSVEPETSRVINNILSSDVDVGPLPASSKVLITDSKAAEGPLSLETPKKTGKIRAKTPKKSRSRKGAYNKKVDTADEVSQPEPSPVKLPDSIPEDPEAINSKAVTVTAGATVAASVVTVVASCRRDANSTITVDTPKEAEHPEVEQPVPKESAFHSGTGNIYSCKKHPPAVKPSTTTLAPAVAHTQSVSHFSVPLMQNAKIPVSPDWSPRSEETRIYVAPPSKVTVVTSAVSASTALGPHSANPPMPPDTKASDIDPSSSTLRKILMEPKYVSASNSNSIPTTMVTSALSNPTRLTENENPSTTLGSRQRHPEERPPLPPQLAHHKPSPLTEFQQNCGEKTQHTIISSPTTSVISRIPMPYDTEEAPRISLSNRSIGLSVAKQKFRSNSNENSRYHGMDVAEDGLRGRSVVEPTHYSTGSSPGLRVNTSEGVVVLSYSGQKTEGPHRMRAKISQIPQASAGDIEFQQSVSKSQIKQDPLVTSSQSPTQKVVQTPTSYGHTGVLLTGQSYNSQPVISSAKKDSLGCDKTEAPYHAGSQGVVKMFHQPVSTPQVLMYNQAVIQQHGKRGLGIEPLAKKIDIGKVSQQSNLSPVMSPHHPSLSGTRMSPSPSIPTDRSALHLKQEPQSPCTTVHSPSPFIKTCPPSSSPIGTSVVLGHGMPQISAYHSSIHHQHTEQSSVIMQPHSVSQAMSHEARMNTPPMSGINYGRRTDSLPSPHPGPAQHSNTPQSNVIRDMVLQSVNPQGSSSGGGSEEDSRHFDQAHSRPSAPQLQTDVLMMHSDHRGHHSSIRVDQYRDMHQRILMHQQLEEQAALEVRQSRISETGTTSLTNIPGPSKSPILGKIMEPSLKEAIKPHEGKIIHPSPNESRIRGVHASSPVVVSPHPHGGHLMHSGGASSFPVYQELHGFSSQFSGHQSSAQNLTNQEVASSQVSVELELGHRGKLPQSLGGGNDSKTELAHLRHATAKDFSHISRISGDTVSPSYQSPMTSPMTSPMGLSHKSDVCLQKGPPSFPTTPLPAAPQSGSAQPRSDAKLEHSRHRSFDMVQLLTKYPIVWQGLLALKNDQAAVQLHFVSGNNMLAQRSLPPPEGGPLLRIVQRMRLETSQLDSVARRMTVENDYCLLLALPCGRDQEDVLGQTQALKSGFITYLQAKQAAGIINVPNPGSNQPAYVVQIFPPCEFSESHLSRLAPDLLNSISSISPHLMIVIASV